MTEPRDIIAKLIFDAMIGRPALRASLTAADKVIAEIPALLPQLIEPPRYGKVKYSTIRRDFEQLRTAIRKHDSFATEEAWEKCERWMEAISPTAINQTLNSGKVHHAADEDI